MIEVPPLAPYSIPACGATETRRETPTARNQTAALTALTFQYWLVKGPGRNVPVAHAMNGHTPRSIPDHANAFAPSSVRELGSDATCDHGEPQHQPGDETRSDDDILVRSEQISPFQASAVERCSVRRKSVENERHCPHRSRKGHRSGRHPRPAIAVTPEGAHAHQPQQRPGQN